MKLGIFSFAAALLLAVPAMAGTDPCAGGPGDADSDTVCDAIDNCRLTPNPTQCDTDSDGFGNHCDGDLNQTAPPPAVPSIDGVDFLAFGAEFALGPPSPPASPNADFNCDGFVDGTDFLAFGAFFGAGEPGPSCLHPVGFPCP
jgi:hypothetical protein